MFVGSVYWFLNLATDLSCCRVAIYDFRTETVVWSSKNYDGFDIAQEVDYHGFGNYDVESFDVYTDIDGSLCIEINIETEEDDED